MVFPKCHNAMINKPSVSLIIVSQLFHALRHRLVVRSVNDGTKRSTERVQLKLWILQVPRSIERASWTFHVVIMTLQIELFTPQPICRPDSGKFIFSFILFFPRFTSFIMWMERDHLTHERKLWLFRMWKLFGIFFVVMKGDFSVFSSIVKFSIGVQLFHDASDHRRGQWQRTGMRWSQQAIHFPSSRPATRPRTIMWKIAHKKFSSIAYSSPGRLCSCFSSSLGVLINYNTFRT